MSSYPSAYLNPPLRRTPSVGQQTQQSIRGLSLTGLLLFVIGVLMIGSGYESMRPIIFGLALHPLLIPVAVAFPLVVLARINEFPLRILITLSAFVGLYLVSIVNGLSLSLSEFFKMSAALVTIVTCALLVRKRGDFVAGSLGLCLAVAALAAKGLTNEDVNRTMDGANKNSYSLFALPAMLLAGYIYLQMPQTRAIFKWSMLVCSLLALFVIFLGGNRSGYLGVALVALMLFWNRKGRGLVLVGIVAAAAIVLISQYGSTKVFDQRLKQTMQGNRSDDLRVRLFRGSFQVALENPITGVSPQQVPSAVATSLGYRGGRLETHNVIGHLAAGSGLLSLLALAGVGWALCFPFSKNDFPYQGSDDLLYQARSLLRMFAILWIVRGQFTREILFSPAFNIGLGLAVGLLILALRARKQAEAQPPGARPVPAVLR